MSTTPESGRNLPYSKEELARVKAERELRSEQVRAIIKAEREMRFENAKARVSNAKQDVTDFIVDTREAAKLKSAELRKFAEESIQRGQDKMMMVGFSAKSFGARLQESAMDSAASAAGKLKSLSLNVADTVMVGAGVATLGVAAAIGLVALNARGVVDTCIKAPMARMLDRHNEWASARREKVEANRATRRAMIAMTKEKVMSGMRDFRNSLESSLRRLGRQLNPLTHLTTMKHQGDLLVVGIGPGKDMERVHQLLLNFRRSVGLDNFESERRTIHIDNRFAAGKIDPVLAPFTADTVVNTFRNTLRTAPAQLADMAAPMAQMFAQRIGDDAKILALAVRSNRAELDRALAKTEHLIRKGELNDEERRYVHQVCLLQGVQDDLVAQQDFRYEQMLAVVERVLQADDLPVEIAEIFMEKARELQPYFKGRETRPVPAVAEDRPDGSHPGGAAPVGPRVEQSEPSTWESSTPGFGI